MFERVGGLNLPLLVQPCESGSPLAYKCLDLFRGETLMPALSSEQHDVP
jgi:hypothetical protein